MAERSRIVWAQNAGDGDYAALYVDGKLLFESWSHPQDPHVLLQQLEGVDVGSVDLRETDHPFFDGGDSWPELEADLSEPSDD